MEDIKQQLSRTIREARKSKGITQKELGEKLGLSESATSRLLNGEQNLTLDTIQKVAEALKIEIVISYR